MVTITTIKNHDWNQLQLLVIGHLGRSQYTCNEANIKRILKWKSVNLTELYQAVKECEIHNQTGDPFITNWLFRNRKHE